MKSLVKLLAQAGLAIGLALVTVTAQASQSAGPTAPGYGASAKPSSQRLPAGSAGAAVQLAYSCGPGQCTCHGDNDCNDMYSGGACKTNGSCETAGGVTCSCATKLKAQTSGGKVIKKPPVYIDKNVTVKKLKQ